MQNCKSLKLWTYFASYSNIFRKVANLREGLKTQRPNIKSYNNNNKNKNNNNNNNFYSAPDLEIIYYNVID